MNKKAIGILGLVLAAALAVFSWGVLPDTVAVQINTRGEVTNTMPRILAILVPFLVSAFGSVMTMMDREEGSKKGLILAIVGIFAMVLTLFFNR
ncbi:MAG: DUF1648 domain-containing protein [Lachnospiraceae bacterium]|nr:DUF1648 domain-containing protein [Lachnospiraceae bacterium]